MTTVDPQRMTYVVDKRIADRAEATLVCSAVLEVLRPRLRVAFVDAYSDYTGEFPADVAAAERWLLARGALRGRGDPGIAIELDPTDDESWAVLGRYAPWSIHVDLWAEPYQRHLGTLHDCGYSITVEMSPGEATRLAVLVAGVAPVVPLALVHTRRRSEKRDAKAARRAGRRLKLPAFLRPD